jgi:ABC-2 type transport system ATP-binding protein
VHRRTGYLPGELHLYDNLTAERQLRYLNALRGGRADWNYVRQLAQRLDLDLKRPIKNLSKGNKQKVGVIQALMHRPELLILDEPTSGLDPLVQREVLSLLREAHAGGATVFFSSHVMSEVEAVAERVGIIRQGRIVEVAETSALVHRTLRRVRVLFQKPVDGAALTNVPGVTLVERTDGTGVLLQVAGDLNPLIQALGHFPVRDLETEHPSLEEVFLAYYEADSK